MKHRDYMFVRPDCINIHDRVVVMYSDEVRLAKSVRTLIDAVLSGIGRVDVVARLATKQGRGGRGAAEQFKASLVGSRIFDTVPLPVQWTGGRVLVCDWGRELQDALPAGSLAWSGPRQPEEGEPRQSAAAEKPARRGKRRAGVTVSEPEDLLVDCPNRSLFVQGQVLRGMLGTNAAGRLVLGGPLDRVLFGDLVFRHRSVTVLAHTWPEARRVWQADPGVLRDTGEWLENLFYALRHTRDEDPVGLLPRAGTTLAGQEVRCLVDSKIVLCWTKAQQRELIRFYGRKARNTPLIDGAGSAAVADAAQRREMVLKELHRVFP